MYVCTTDKSCLSGTLRDIPSPEVRCVSRTDRSIYMLDTFANRVFAISFQLVSEVRVSLLICWLCTHSYVCTYSCIFFCCNWRIVITIRPHTGTGTNMCVWIAKIGTMFVQWPFTFTLLPLPFRPLALYGVCVCAFSPMLFPRLLSLSLADIRADMVKLVGFF